MSNLFDLMNNVMENTMKTLIIIVAAIATAATTNAAVQYYNAYNQLVASTSFDTVERMRSTQGKAYWSGATIKEFRVPGYTYTAMVFSSKASAKAYMAKYDAVNALRSEAALF